MPKRNLRALLIGSATAAAVAACGLAMTALAQTPDQGWRHNGGLESNHYSPLTQITKVNVARLKPVWTFLLEAGGLEAQPMVLGRTLYAITPTQRLVALDAATGAQKWVFDPKVPGGQPVRGLSSWTDGKTSRIVYSDQNMIFLLDPATGKPDGGFGDGGHIDLRGGLRGKAEDNVFFLTTPAVVWKDLIIVGGGRVAETYPSSPSPARAYDVRTGKLVWRFDTLPQPGQPGAETWPKDAHLTQGGANAWQGTTVDAGRGIVFINTGSPAEDFYGVARPGANRFANSTIALDARTGRRLWDFQQVHHDLWDSDSTSPPLLMTVNRNGKPLDVVVATNKHSYVYAFERTTGKPLWPIRETAVPASTVPGEKAWPSQPIPSLPRPMSRTHITAADLLDSDPATAARARRAFADLAGAGGNFVPLSIDKDTIVAPGFAGGPSLYGMAADKKGFLYASSANASSVGGLVEYAKLRGTGVGDSAYLTQCAACHGRDRVGNPPEFPSLLDIGKRMSATEIAEVVRKGRGRMPPFASLPQVTLDNLVSYLTTGADIPGTEPPPVRRPGVGEGGGTTKYVFTGYRQFADAKGQSYLKGPLATLNAINMNTGAYAWTVPFVMGGGPTVTASGLLFITSGSKLQAYDTANGRLLWEADLPGFGTTPAVYSVGGKQYVAVAAGSPRGRAAQGAGPPKPGAYVVFALPD